MILSSMKSIKLIGVSFGIKVEIKMASMLFLGMNLLTLNLKGVLALEIFFLQSVIWWPKTFLNRLMVKVSFGLTFFTLNMVLLIFGGFLFLQATFGFSGVFVMPPLSWGLFFGLTSLTPIKLPFFLIIGALISLLLWILPTINPLKPGSMGPFSCVLPVKSWESIVLQLRSWVVIHVNISISKGFQQKTYNNNYVFLITYSLKFK